MTNGDWRSDGLCSQVGGWLWFPAKGETSRPAKRLCALCPVREECLEYAVVTFQKHGIWGGTSPHQREKMRVARGLSEPPAMNRAVA